MNVLPSLRRTGCVDKLVKADYIVHLPEQLKPFYRRGAENAEEEEERSGKSEIKFQSEIVLVSARLCVLCVSAVRGLIVQVSEQCNQL